MQYNNIISLDLNGRTTGKIVQVKQYDDEGRVLNIEITKDGNPTSIPADAIVTFRVIRPDGFAVLVSSEGDYVTYINSTVVITLKSSMLSIIGNAIADILITKDGENLSSATFTLQVNPSAYRDEQITAEADFPVLQEVLNRSEELISSMSSSVKAAERYARLSQGYRNEAETAAANARKLEESTKAYYQSTAEEAAKLFNRVMDQSDFDEAESLDPGIYFVKLGV